MKFFETFESKGAFPVAPSHTKALGGKDTTKDAIPVSPSVIPAKAGIHSCYLSLICVIRDCSFPRVKHLHRSPFFPAAERLLSAGLLGGPFLDFNLPKGVFCRCYMTMGISRREPTTGGPAMRK
jgi:hypothetical protein